MRNKLYLLALAGSLLAYAPPAFAADESTSSSMQMKQSDDGSYSKTSKSENTDANGTDTSQQKTDKVTRNSDGSMKHKVQTKTSTDPKGLGNKTTETSTDVTAQDANGKTKHSHTTKVNGTTTEDSSTESSN